MHCNLFLPFSSAVLLMLVATRSAVAAEYGLSASSSLVEVGSILPVTAMVRTQAGDNVVGAGYFSFAVDLRFSGSAPVLGSAVSDLTINTGLFDDLVVASFGLADDDRYIGIAGATTDLVAPSFGQIVGDVIPLFTFDLLIPQTAALGETITITPSEGFLENLVIGGNFPPVAPQTFSSLELTVVPEPSGAFLLLFGILGAFGPRHRKYAISLAAGKNGLRWSQGVSTGQK